MKTKKSKKKDITEEELEELQRDKIPECSKEGCEIINSFLEKDLEEVKKDEIEQLA